MSNPNHIFPSNSPLSDEHITPRRTSTRIEPLDNTHSIEEQKEQAASMDMDSLRAAAEKRSTEKGELRHVVEEKMHGDPYISQYAKKRAAGVCQLCEKPAPFKDAEGMPYLEAHHVVWLAKGGEDSMSNTVALCPNCHRKMHVLNDPKDVECLMRKCMRR